MIFAISLRHDNQQCIDKIIDFTCHHLMTKSCRNACGAQELMKLAFSAPRMVHHHLSALAGMSYRFHNGGLRNTKLQYLGIVSIIANDL
jgi:hypothetical protein